MKLFSLGLLLGALAVSSADAGTHVWTGASSDRFSDGGNWTGGSPAGDPDAELFFSTTAGSYTPQNDIDGLSVRSISISAGGYTIGGKAITVTRDVMNTIGQSIVACDLILIGDVTFFVDANGVNVLAALSLDGAVRGTGRLIKDGGSPLRMRGRAPNTYSGGTVVRRGYLILEKGANVIAIPGDVRIFSTIESLLPEQIADDAEVTFEGWGELTIERNETIGSIVAIGDPNGNRADGSVNVMYGWAAALVRRDIRASGNIEVYFDRLHLATPLAVTLEDRASFRADFEGDAPLTIRATEGSRLLLESRHSSPTFIENASSDVEFPNSPIVQRGGSFTGKAASLRMDGGTLSSAGVGGELSLTAATRVLAGRSISGGPVRLGGATLITTGALEPRPLGTVVPVIQNFSGPVIGTFAGLPEGAVINGYTLTYRGGDGNDVEFRAPAPAPAIQVTDVASVGKVRLDVSVQYFTDRGTAPLTIRHNGQLLGTVQLTNGSGTIELTLAPGSYALDLEYPGDARLAPAKLTYTVRVKAPTPVLTSVEPNVIKGGSGKVTVTVKGSNFVPGARVVVSSSGYPAEFVSSTELRWIATANGEGAPARTGQLHVSQGPESVRSNSVPFTWEAGPPADPRRLTFTINSITAEVRPGATVLMAMTGYPVIRSGQTLLTDSDRDGKVTWQLTRPPNLICAVIDLETGEYYIEGSEFVDREELPLPLALHRGPSGAYSNIVLGNMEPPRVLWVRRGVGAWSVEVRDGATGDADEAFNGMTLFDASAMAPIGSSPATPAGVERGDLMIALSIHDAQPYVTKIDDSHFAPDVPGTLAISESVSADEEDGTARVVLFRNDGSAGRVSARVTTFDKTAKSGTDYLPFDARVTLEPGEMWKAFEIPLIDDALFAGGRRFGVRRSEPAGAAIEAGETEIHLGEAEDPPVVSVDDVSVSEGDGPGTVATTIRLTGATRVAIDVEWYLFNFSLAPATGKLVFNPGETQKQIVIPFRGDRIAGGDSRHEIGLKSLVARTASKRGYLTMVEDDVARISIRDASVTEGSGTRTIEITVDLDIVATRTVRVNFTTRDGSATAGTDYTATTATATFSTFTDTTARLRIPIVGDGVAEGPEWFEIVLSNPEGAALQRSIGRVTIADDDAKPTVSISDASGPEGESLSFVIQLSSPAPEAVTVNVTTAPGTAAAADYHSSPNAFAITIPAGATTRWAEISATEDALVESDETFTVTLASASNATLGRVTATGTILDRGEPPVILSISDAQVVEGNAGEKSVTAVVSVNRQGHPAIRLTWSTADGTATAGTDYVAAKGELTFLSFETAKFVSFVVKGDTLREPDETFRLVLSNVTGVTVVRSEALVTVIDDEGGERRRSVKKN